NPDACDPCPLDAFDDADRDGRCANVDNCDVIANVRQLDSDLDGVGDLCDVCPYNGNPAQADADGDGAGDLCDCAPNDASVRPPPAVPSLAMAKAGMTAVLTWPSVPSADTFAILRGAVGTVHPGALGDCFADGLTQPAGQD